MSDCMASMLKLIHIYLWSKHTAIWTNCLITIWTVILHFYIMLTAFLFKFLILVHTAYEMFNIINESLTICEWCQRKSCSTMRALGPSFLNPWSQTVLTSEFTTIRTHSRFANIAEANIALKKGCVHHRFGIICLHLCFS